MWWLVGSSPRPWIQLAHFETLASASGLEKWKKLQKWERRSEILLEKDCLGSDRVIIKKCKSNMISPPKTGRCLTSWEGWGRDCSYQT